jgi:hypothetical protein
VISRHASTNGSKSNGEGEVGAGLEVVAALREEPARRRVARRPFAESVAQVPPTQGRAAGGRCSHTTSGLLATGAKSAAAHSGYLLGERAMLFG